MTIQSILEKLKNSIVIEATEEITSLSKDSLLEIYRKYAEEIKPNIFVNTDIGSIINAQVDILSYVVNDFLVNLIDPSSGTIGINRSSILSGDELLWKIVFNSKINPTQLLNLVPYFNVNRLKKIYNISVQSASDSIFYITDDYYFCANWKISWNHIGVESFDLYYIIEGGTETLWKSDLKSNWSIFTFTPDIYTATLNKTIQFIVKSHAEPTVVNCYGKLWNTETSQPTGSETLLTSSVDLSSNVNIVNQSGSGDNIWIYNNNISDVYPNDNFKLTILDTLTDENDVAVNDGVDFISDFSTLDNFRIDYINIINGSVSDPNQIYIRFNRDCGVNENDLKLYVKIYKSSDDITYTEISDNTDYYLNYNILIINPAISDLNSKYYKLVFDGLNDLNGYVLIESGTEIKFENNHEFVYDSNGNLIVDELGQLVKIG